MREKTAVEFVAELAHDTELTDPIDWGELSIDEETAYKLMAAHVLEMDLSQPYVTQAIITKLLVENFVLNLKILGKR